MALIHVFPSAQRLTMGALSRRYVATMRAYIWGSSKWMGSMPIGPEFSMCLKRTSPAP